MNQYREGKVKSCLLYTSRVAQFSLSELEDALQNPDIIRHKLKLEATVNNAKQVLKIQDEFGSLSHYFWHFFDGKPLINNVPTYKDVPSSTALSQPVSYTHLRQP